MAVIDPPGAVLDGQPWAKSWATFLAAVNDRFDPEARQFIANAMGDRVPGEGGFLVPEQLRSQVLAYLTPAIMRPEAMVLPMDARRMAIPTLDNPSQANGGQALGGLVLSFVEDGQLIPTSNPAFGRVVLEARKLAGRILAPNELSDDAAGAWGDFLARIIGMGLAWVEDDYFIGPAGTGAGVPQSIINAPCAVKVARSQGGQVLFADAMAMMKALHPASKQAAFTPGTTGVSWLASVSVMDQLMELYYSPAAGEAVTPSGGFSPGDGDKTGPSWFGVPLRVTDHQPAVGQPGDLALTDLRHYLIGDRQVMTVERSEAGATFPMDVSQWRVRSRVDGRYWIPSSTTTEIGQVVSPVVVLQ